MEKITEESKSLWEQYSNLELFRRKTRYKKNYTSLRVKNREGNFGIFRDKTWSKNDNGNTFLWGF